MVLRVILQIISASSSSGGGDGNGSQMQGWKKVSVSIESDTTDINEKRQVTEPV